MITLHRLGHADEPFQINPDLIVFVESTPDTVVTLATTAKVVVAERPDEVADAVRAWRVEVLSEAMRNRRGGRTVDAEESEEGPERTKQAGRAWRAKRAGSVERLPGRPARVEGSRPGADVRGR